jgi:FkbM family methyltransferase
MIKKIESFEYDFHGDLFVDIGGNIGMWSSAVYDDYKKIIFIEPSSEAIEVAKTKINDQQGKVKFLKNICSNESGQIKSIATPSEDSGQFSVFGQELYTDINRLEEGIETITLDSLISEASEGNRILIKIDTEGCDLDVILGGKEFIKKFKPTLAIEFHFHMYFDDEKYEKVVNFLNDLGYIATEYKFPGYRGEPNRLFDGKHNGLEMYDMHYHMLAEPTQ